jgi:hypothetical protein
VSTVDTFTIGFYAGNLLYLGVLALVFWFVGRWGWVGLLIRIVCAALLLLRVVTLITLMNPPSS